MNVNVRNELRWYLKKVSRFGVSRLSKILAPSKPENSEVVRVLTYHTFGNQRKDPFCVTAHDFESHIKLLSAQQRAINLEQLQSHLAGEVKLPKNACLVTIDDGMISILETALPVLEKYGVPAVAFVSSNLVGKSSGEQSERYMTWTELQELTRSGLVSIGSHAHTHRSMDKLSDEELMSELTTSRKLLSEKLNTPVTAFAYPFGMRKDFSSRTDTAVLASGYDIGFNSIHGPVPSGVPAVSLPRVKIEGGESLNMFSDITRGAMDAWRFIDDRFWRLQLVRSEIT